ncbi:MAG: VTC domain-containing protein [Verrucomicrobiae bacterium]|nr:VTC domain-containing protein [Verrucomicrobiae bacterium]
MLEDPALPEAVRMELAHMEPALINRYRRKYFLSADGHYRITVDTGLEFYRVHRHDNRFLVRSIASGQHGDGVEVLRRHRRLSPISSRSA